MNPQAPHAETNQDTFPHHFYRLEFMRLDGTGIQEHWREWIHDLLDTLAPMKKVKLSADKGKFSDQWPYPIAYDSYRAAPNNHKLLYEDNHVRLIEVSIRPGETENVEGVPYPSVVAEDAVSGTTSEDRPLDANSPLTEKVPATARLLKDWKDLHARPWDLLRRMQYTILERCQSTFTGSSLSASTETDSKHIGASGIHGWQSLRTSIMHIRTRAIITENSTGGALEILQRLRLAGRAGGRVRLQLWIPRRLTFKAWSIFRNHLLLSFQIFAQENSLGNLLDRLASLLAFRSQCQIRAFFIQIQIALQNPFCALHNFSGFKLVGKI